MGYFGKKTRFPSSMFSLMAPHHIYLGLILKNSDYELSWMMQRTLCINTYQFHFFVLLVIFMPNPTAPYLCSQLASVTKGLCKQLLQANRFLPTSHETASCAAPICPPGMNKNITHFHLFYYLLTLHLIGRLRRNRRINKPSTKPAGFTFIHSLSSTWTQRWQQPCPHLCSQVLLCYWKMAAEAGGWPEPYPNKIPSKHVVHAGTALVNTEQRLKTGPAVASGNVTLENLWLLPICKWVLMFLSHIRFQISLWRHFLILCVAFLPSLREMCIN